MITLFLCKYKIAELFTSQITLQIQPKAHVTHNIFAHNIEIKRHFDK